MSNALRAELKDLRRRNEELESHYNVTKRTMATQTRRKSTGETMGKCKLIAVVHAVLRKPAATSENTEPHNKVHGKVGNIQEVVSVVPVAYAARPFSLLKKEKKAGGKYPIEKTATSKIRNWNQKEDPVAVNPYPRER